MKNIYELSKDGEVVLTGTSRQIADYLGYTKASYITARAHYVGTISDYQIRLIDGNFKHTSKKPNSYHFKPVAEEIDYLVYLRNNLRRFGNTIMLHNPEKYLKVLEEEGIKTNFYKVITKTAKGKKETHWHIDLL